MHANSSLNLSQAEQKTVENLFLLDDFILGPVYHKLYHGTIARKAAKHVFQMDQDDHDGEKKVMSNQFTTRPRGRPRMDANERRERIGRREIFGLHLKNLRMARRLTLATAAEAAGIDSARKLSQYETKCYPPGRVLRILASVYHVTPKYLSALKLAHSDPDDWESISDGISPEKFSGKTEDEQQT